MLAIALLLIAAPVSAQTADEIIENYLTNTGGAEAWESVESVKFIGSVDLGGMSLPIEVYRTKDGKGMIKAEFQGQQFYQNVYDGETLWGTNQMTMAAEKSDAESTANYKNEINDFPDPFLNYKDKGYTAELLGTETMDGTETYKIKLIKEPVLVDGKEQDDIAFYYFDTENFVPIAIETEMSSGPAKGMTSVTVLSDYQEVDGLYFAFSILEKIQGAPQGQQITFTDIEINPEIDATMFAYPEKN